MDRVGVTHIRQVRRGCYTPRRLPENPFADDGVGGVESDGTLWAEKNGSAECRYCGVAPTIAPTSMKPIRR